jgi:hypothetical protein
MGIESQSLYCLSCPGSLMHNKTREYEMVEDLTGNFSTHKFCLQFCRCRNVDLSKFSKEVPAEAANWGGGRVTTGANKLLVQGTGRWQHVENSRTCLIPSQSFPSRTSTWGIPQYCMKLLSYCDCYWSRHF